MTICVSNPVSKKLLTLAAVLAIGTSSTVVVAAEPAKDATPKVKSVNSDKPKTDKPKSDKKAKSDIPPPDEWGPMDYGPCLATSVARPSGKPLKVEKFESANVPNFPVDQTPDLIATRGIVIPFGNSDDPTKAPTATLCFDTETLGMTGWTGGWLDLRGSMFINHKGTFNVTTTGQEAFATKGAAADGRIEFLGHYLNARNVILKYRINGTEILELPGFEGDATGGVFTRTLHVAPHAAAIKLALGKRRDDFRGGGVEVKGTSGSANYRDDNGVLSLELTPTTGVSILNVHIGPGRAKPNLTDPATLVAGGSPRWTPITTQGVVGKSMKPSRTNRAADPSFAVDTLTLPVKNPWNSWMRLGGVDFFPDGRAAVCTLNGDVWIASNIDESLSKLTWTRFATGLYQPLGIAVVDGKVCVRGRDQLTRLHDLNNDGEADFYENVSEEGGLHPSYHALVFDLLADKADNFFYARGGLGMDPSLENFGRLLKLSPDGSITPLATGLRQPNGIGLVGNGWITVSDNQGNWIPSSKIHVIDPKQVTTEHPAQFLGYLPHHHQESMPKEPVQPMVWIPHTLDNSSGGQCEVPAGAWGPYAGQWIHTSFGSASVMMLLPDASAKKGELPKQAAVARLPFDFATGIMRPRFNPVDKQLYVAGVGGGWQTKGTADGGLYRVRYIEPKGKGTAGATPTGFAVVPGGIQLSFPQPLDKKEATDPQNYAVEQWNYKWTEQYGSPDFSAKTPGKAGHDEVDVKSAKLSEDGRTVTLGLANLMPVNQMRIQSIVFTADGAEYESEVFATVNEVPK